MYTIHFKYLRGFNFIKTRYKKLKNKLEIFGTIIFYILGKILFLEIAISL